MATGSLLSMCRATTRRPQVYLLVCFALVVATLELLGTEYLWGLVLGLVVVAFAAGTFVLLTRRRPRVSKSALLTADCAALQQACLGALRRKERVSDIRGPKLLAGGFSIVARTTPSPVSNGERIAITAVPVTTGRCRCTITSVARIWTNRFDGGTNEDNVRGLFETICLKTPGVEVLESS